LVHALPWARRRTRVLQLHVRGWHLGWRVPQSFSTEVEESADRELLLVAPIRFRPAGLEKAALIDTSAFVVSARRLMFMDVQYLEGDVDPWEIERGFEGATNDSRSGSPDQPQ